MRGNQALQGIGFHALPVYRSTHQVRAIQAKTIDRGQKRRAFDNHFVARVDQDLAQQVQSLLAAGGDDELLSAQIGHALVRHQCDQLFTQRAVALGCAVLQSRTRVLLQRGQRGLAYAIDIKQCAIRKAARKADDAGLAQQLEQFADGRGLDVVKPVGIRQGGGSGHLRYLQGWSKPYCRQMRPRPRFATLHPTA